MSKCLSCNKETNAANLMSCSRCGRIVCDDCGEKNFSLCSVCNADMKHLQ